MNKFIGLKVLVIVSIIGSGAVALNEHSLTKRVTTVEEVQNSIIMQTPPVEATSIIAPTVLPNTTITKVPTKVAPAITAPSNPIPEAVVTPVAPTIIVNVPIIAPLSRDQLVAQYRTNNAQPDCKALFGKEPTTNQTIDCTHARQEYTKNMNAWVDAQLAAQ